MSAAEWLDLLARALGIKAGEAAQVLAGLLGAAVGMAAALAAWRSARLAQFTVTEMREARLQAARPLFEIKTPGEVTWGVMPGSEAPEVWSEADDRRLNGLVLRFENIGAGQALDVEVTVTFEPFQLRADSKNRLRRFLGHQGISADFAADKVELRLRDIKILDASPFEPGANSLGPALGGSLGRCPSGQAVEFRVFSSYAAFLLVIAMAREVNPHLPDQMPRLASGKLYLRYRSITGERFSEEYRIGALGYCTVNWSGAGLPKDGRAWRWFEARASLFVGKARPELTVAETAVQALFGNQDALRRLTGLSRRQRLRRRWARRRAIRRHVRRLFAERRRG